MKFAATAISTMATTGRSPAPSVALGGARHRQHVVERHRQVGDDDLRDGGAEAHGGTRPRVAAHDRAPASGMRLALADLAVHLPAHPQQQDAAGERQADDGEQLHRDGGKDDAQDDGAGHAPEDHLARISGGTREAASPTTMALSPASTTSMTMTLRGRSAPGKTLPSVLR